MAPRIIRRWGGNIAVVLFGLLFIAIPALLTPDDVIKATGSEGDLVLSLVQLVALVIPALAIFTQVLMEFSYRREEQSGKSGGVGRFGPDVFRGGVVMGAGISSLFLSMGLVSLLHSLQLPEGTSAGVLLILLGVAYIPGLVMGVALLIFFESIG